MESSYKRNNRNSKSKDKKQDIILTKIFERKLSITKAKVIIHTKTNKKATLKRKVVEDNSRARSVNKKRISLNSSNERKSSSKKPVDRTFSTKKQVLIKSKEKVKITKKKKENVKESITSKSTLSITNLTTISVKKDLGPKRIRLGLCCMNNLLRSQKKTVFCSRSITLNTYNEKGASVAKEK
jgi:hypothetical protein